MRLVRISRTGTPPALTITVNLEASPTARVDVESFAAELRLLDDLENRDDLVEEIAEVLALTVELLRNRARMANPGDTG